MLMRNLKKARCKTRSVAYKTICRPILEYATQSWCPYMAKDIKRLESINRKAFRWAYGLRKRDHISALMTAADWDTLEVRRQTADLKLYARILAGNTGIDEKKIQLRQSTHHTRRGAIKRTVNTEVQRNSFKMRVYRYLNPVVHRLSSL